jgi:hypothetical protein
MSIARTAARIAAVRAITGRTLAGERVADSAIDPIDIAVVDERIPIITVTTDDDVLDELGGRDIQGGTRRVDLVFEAAVATKVEVNGEVTIVIPQTDFGIEMSLDIIEQQIERALFASETDWSRCFMRLVPRIFRRTSRRGAGSRKGARFAARQIVYSIDIIACPQPGVPLVPGLPYDDLLALMAATPDLEPFSRLMRSIIEGDPLSDWHATIAQAGLLPSEARAIGIMPVDLTVEADEAEAALAEIGEVVGFPPVPAFTEIVRGRAAIVVARSNIAAAAIRVPG